MTMEDGVGSALTPESLAVNRSIDVFASTICAIATSRRRSRLAPTSRLWANVWAIQTYRSRWVRTPTSCHRNTWRSQTK